MHLVGLLSSYFAHEARSQEPKACVSKSLNLLNSSHYIETVQNCCNHYRQIQFFIAFISNAACFGPSYGPTSGTEHVYKTQICVQVNIWNFGAHKFYNFVLTIYLLMWRIWWPPNNVSKGQMGFNSAFKELIIM